MSLIVVIVALLAFLVLIDRLAIVLPDIILTVMKLVGTFASIGAGVVAIFSNNLVRGARLQPLGCLLVAIIIVGAGATYEADRLKDRSDTAQSSDLLFVGSLAALPFQNVRFSDVELTVNTADPIFADLLGRIRQWNNFPDIDRDAKSFQPLNADACFQPTAPTDATIDDQSVYDVSSWTFHENSSVIRARNLSKAFAARIFPWSLDPGTRDILRPGVSLEIYSKPQPISTLRTIPKDSPPGGLYWTNITHEGNIGNFVLTCTDELPMRCREILFAERSCAGSPIGAIRIYGVPELVDKQLVIRVAPELTPGMKLRPGVVPFHLHGFTIDIDHRAYDIDLRNAAEYTDSSGGIFVVYTVKGPLKNLLLTSCSSEGAYCDPETRTEPKQL